jgi:hypothetical protein
MSLCPFMCLSLAKSSTHLPAPDLHHPFELRGEIDMPQSSQCISPLRPHTIVRSSSLKTERPGRQRPRNCSFTVPIISKDRNTYPCSCPRPLSLIQMIGSKEGTAWGGLDVCVPRSPPSDCVTSRCPTLKKQLPSAVRLPQTLASSTHNFSSLFSKLVN